MHQCQQIQGDQQKKWRRQGLGDQHEHAGERRPARDEEPAEGPARDEEPAMGDEGIPLAPARERRLAAPVKDEEAAEEAATGEEGTLKERSAPVRAEEIPKRDEDPYCW